jgi:phosphatidylserine decarboxylase
MPILDSTRRVLVFILQVLENLSLERVNALISSLKSQISILNYSTHIDCMAQMAQDPKVKCFKAFRPCLVRECELGVVVRNDRCNIK